MPHSTCSVASTCWQPSCGLKSVDPAEGALEELQQVMQHIRSRWPQTRILVRGDSAYSRENIMAWCESQGIDYVFGLASNERLVRMTLVIQEKACAEYAQTKQLATWYRSLCYKTLESWTRFRRVVGYCRLCIGGI